MDSLPRQHFGAILADPPWRFEVWSGETAVQKRGSKTTYKAAQVHYETMSMREIARLPVEELAAVDCALFMWVTWPTLIDGLNIMEAWGFPYKTCAFNWMKAHAGQIELFEDEITPLMKMGYWTRASSEVCLFGTRGKPKRLNADVRQGIVAPVRQHSRKPEGVHDRIERLIAGPYLELFGREKREGWTVWGNQTDKFHTPSEWDSMWRKPFTETNPTHKAEVVAVPEGERK